MTKYIFDICRRRSNYLNIENEILRFVSNYTSIKQHDSNIEKYLLVPKDNNVYIPMNNHAYIACLYFSCTNPSELFDLRKKIVGTEYYINFITKEHEETLTYIYNSLVVYEEMTEINRIKYKKDIKLLHKNKDIDLSLHNCC